MQVKSPRIFKYGARIPCYERDENFTFILHAVIQK